MVTLQLVLGAVCLLSAVWLLALIARDRLPDRPTLVALAVVEVGLLVNLVLGVVRVLGPHHHVTVWEYVGYLLGLVVLLPAGVVWAAGERSRGGTAVLLVAVLVVPFLFLRLHDIWAGGA